MICRGCGGLVGRDCWNPQECEWISEQMAIDAAVQKAMADRDAQEHAAHYAQQHEDYLAACWYEHIGFDPILLGM